MTDRTEAALALARKYTGCSSVMSFTNLFRGMLRHFLAISGSSSRREQGDVARHDVIRVSYDGY
ncbi:hypothetical protein [Bradyrhizobium murdochi]|uniref:hypothetical protein n=1 Tax=Bradyrhizobium murdochi TaxID=1038859 RepID=UPI0003F80D74|nr:hypothetical protein [Bradyrhizobium murdochi]